MAVEQIALDGIIPNVTGRPEVVKVIMMDPATGASAGAATSDKQDDIIAALAAPLAVVPQMASGGNLSAQTNATGTTYTAFASQACKQLTIVNNTGTKIEFQQGGAGIAVPIFDQSAFTVFGITNANQIGIRRVDTTNVQVTAQARWEA